MTEIIIPIKSLPLAKNRLSGLLAPAQRTELVLAMLQDLLTVVCACDPGRIWLVASDDAVADIGHAFSARTIRETRVRGYNSAVALAFESVPGNGPVAVLPGDVPLANFGEIAALTASTACGEPTIRLAPARDGSGTNGLFLSDRSLIEPGFGVNSFTRYRVAARAAGIKAGIITAPGLAHDLDTPADLRDFARRSESHATRSFGTVRDCPDVLCRGAA